MTLLITFLLTALIVSFFCSLLESVIMSVSHPYIALLVKNGHKSGHLLGELKHNINHPLAAILTLNTVANTIGAAGVGAQTFSLFGSKWVAASSVVLTILILICSEIIPKTIGAVYWKQLAPFSAYSLRVMIFLLYPIVRILEGISGLVSSGKPLTRITREELKVLAEIGEDEGILMKKEARIFENLLLLSEIRTEDILTPRAVILAVNKDRTIADVIGEHPSFRFTRIPVFGESLDDIPGVVFASEIIEAFYTGRESQTIESLMKPIHAVPEAKSIANLLDEFISRREHMFLVVDEYGGNAGIVTLEDAIETLLGVEILDELDTVADMRAFAQAKWKRRKKKG